MLFRSESVCLQCGRPGFDPWVGKFPGEGNGNPLQYSGLENPMDGGAWCPWGRKELDTTERLHFFSLMVKNLPINAGDLRDVGSVPGFGRSYGGGHSNTIQYSCLEDPMDGGAWCPWGCKELDTTERLHSLMILQAASELIFVAETVS